MLTAQEDVHSALSSALEPVHPCVINKGRELRTDGHMATHIQWDYQMTKWTPSNAPLYFFDSFLNFFSKDVY